jgi:hypothetical protein
MPRKLINDYVFYKFVCDDENIECCYVGSTANFNDRKRTHLKNCNNSNPNDKRTNYKIYETIRENGGWKNWKMVIIGEAKEISLTQSRILEQNYIDELKEKLNMIRAYTSTEHRKEQKKEYSKEYDKIRYENNKEEENKRSKDWRDLNKEKLIEQRKTKYLNNTELIKERVRTYREANKDKINEMRRLNYLKKKNEKIV